MNALRALAGAALVAALAALLWASPVSSLTPPSPPEGDANCDGVVNSIDATLILQVDAGLIDAVPCAGGVDVNLDGVINSLDAEIILQMEAGLCCPTLSAELTIDSLPNGIPYGEPIEIVLAITNTGDQPVTRRYNSGQMYDFVILDPQGQLAWQWSRGMAFIEAITHQTFEAGATTTYRVEWNQQDFFDEQVQPGTYRLSGEDVGCSLLPPRECELREWIDFEILPPPQ